MKSKDSYIDSFIQALENRKRNGKITYEIILNQDNRFQKKGVVFPNPIIDFYKRINYLNIDFPRSLLIKNINELSFLENGLMWFSTVDNNNFICFDTATINSAGEWDIVNYANKFTITRTLASFITNKTWAWIDREKKIWEQQLY